MFEQREEIIMCEEFTLFIVQLINIKTCLKKDFILELIDEFNVFVEKLMYPDNNVGSLSVALDFYKNFNLDYYNMIIQGINNKDIILDGDSSNVNTKSCKAYIKLMGNDGDIITIVHELAHYIDSKSNPHIVPNNYWFLEETFAFYIERELEKFLGQEYKYLFDIRKNNRLYMEKNMLEIIKLALHYENEYFKNGKLELTEKDSKNIKRIMKVGENNLINFCLSYPIANITSLYLVNFCTNVTHENFCELCLSYNIEEFFYDNCHLIGLDNKIFKK